MTPVDQMPAHNYAPFSCSPTIGKLAEALSAAQATIKSAEKDRVNPHFKSKYATLDACWEACRDSLSKHGIAVMQLPSMDGALVTLTTVLAHGSGEWVSSAVTLVASDSKPQSVGSALTYGRRYGLCAAVGVAPEEDDDGNATSRRGVPDATERDAQQQAKIQQQFDESRQLAEAGKTPPAKINKAQVAELIAAATTARWSTGEFYSLMQAHGFTNEKHVTADKFPVLLDALRNGTVVPFTPKVGEVAPVDSLVV